MVGSGPNARTTVGTSSTPAANLIQAAREAFGDKDSVEPNPNDLNDKVWDHIRNFWYRDGDLFALMLDDNACDMMGGGVYDSNKKQDVVTHIGNNTLTYEIRDEDHHMEYLRDFCEEMGGDLWAPSSQQEYDDLFEREGGVCDKTGQVYENGEPYGNLGWNKIEVYLNLHREGYLQCPEADRVQTPTGTACPTQAYYDSLNTCNGECDNNRNLENNAPPTSADDFYTTDSYFGGKNDICTNDVRSIFKYSKFLADATPDPAICPESTGGNPFIHENCWQGTNAANQNGNVERFQKFIEQDVYTINRILSQTGGTVQRQKDCVVAICNDGPPTEPSTGPANDQRRKSEWNMDHCNQQRHVGICRMKLTGCNKPSYACKDNYKKTCGDRSVFTESFTMYKNAAIQAAMEQLKNQGGNTAEQNEGIDDPSTEDASATGNRDVVFANGEPKVDVEAYLTSVGETGVDVVETTTPSSITETCDCDCSFSTWNKFSTANNIGTDVIADSQVVRAPVSAPSNSLSTIVGYTCQDGDACYSGSAEAQCVMNNNGYEAAWKWTGNTPAQSICSSSCCPAQNLTPDGSMRIKSGSKTVYKDGDQVVFECTNPNNHLTGNENSNTITVTADFTNPQTPCFTPPTCETPNCKTCPTIPNGYCYDQTNLGGSATSWAPGKSLRCRCDRCFMMKGSATGFPWLSTTCIPDWEAENGQCVPLKCANPRDLTDNNGNLIGWPAGTAKAGCGESIEYECAEGMMADMSNAADSTRSRPYSNCDDNADYPNEQEGERGSQGFFSAVQGTCVPKMCKVADLGDETDAWKPVFFANTFPSSQCHDAAVYNAAPLVNAQSLLKTANAELPEGSIAIYECFDDYNAIQNTDFRETAYDVVQDLACAAGPKTEADDCRLQETDKLIENWVVNNQKTIATNNDKLIARCVNGEWVKPSHHCLCNDQPLTTSVKYFEAVCPAETSGRGEGTQAPSGTTSAYVHKLGFGLVPLVFYVGF